jgi:murein DD-endopeptidase MepM/ murein hydrolase activator NlpD
MPTRPARGGISSPYGWRKHPISGLRTLHTGTDYGYGGGMTLVAPIRCKVLAYGWAGGYGNRMVLSGQYRGDTITFWLNHLAGSAVPFGLEVPEGFHVANMGTTGNSTGVHLHLEVFLNAKRVDPEAWFTQSTTAGDGATLIEDDMPLNDDDKKWIAKTIENAVAKATGGYIVQSSDASVLVGPGFVRSLNKEEFGQAIARYPVTQIVANQRAFDVHVDIHRPLPTAPGNLSVDLAPVLDAISGLPTAEQNGAAARAAIVK